MHITTATPPEYLIRVPSPIGRLEVVSDGEAITGLSIERAGALPWDDEPERSNAVLEQAAQQLREYFAGERTDFDLPVRAAGTPFQQAVWAGIADLGFGQVASYGELGVLTGRATAGRAVGGAVGESDPDHRSVPSRARQQGARHRVQRRRGHPHQALAARPRGRPRGVRVTLGACA